MILAEERYMRLKMALEDMTREYIEAAKKIGMDEADIKIELFDEICWEAGLKDFEQ